MRRSISFGLERIALTALRAPLLSAIAMLVLLTTIALSLPSLQFDQQINRVFLSESPVSQMQRDFETSQSPKTLSIMARISSAKPLTAEEMTALQAIALDLEFNEGVLAVGSPFLLRTPPDETAPSGRPLFGPDVPANYSEDVDTFVALDTGLPTYLSRDLDAAQFTITVDREQTDLETAEAEARAVIEAGLPDGLSYAITGETLISREISRGLKRDLVRLNLAGIVLVSLATLFLLRDVRMTLLTVVPAFFGAAGVLALSVWLGYPITVLSNVIPILLLVLGGANCLHLARHLRHSSGSVHVTLREIGPACALSSITTAFAFASIMITKNSQVFEFAVLGTLGTLLSYLISNIAFALLALHLGGRSRRPTRAGAALADWFATMGARRPRITTIAAVGLLALTGFAFTQTTPWFALQNNLPRDSHLRDTNDAIAADFGGVFQMIVEVEDDPARTQAVAEALIEAARPGTVLSEAGLVRWRGSDPGAASQANGLLPDGLITALRPGEATQRIFVTMPEPMRDAETLNLYERLFEVAQQAGADRVFGMPVVMRQEGMALITELARSLVIASLGASLFVAYAFRKPCILPLLLIVNVLPLMIAGGALHLFNEGRLTPTAVLALTIAFGIAIDDTIHFLGRFYRSRENGESVGPALRLATGSAGQSMVLTTMLLSAGLAVTLFSGFAPIRLFGGMIIAILWAALLADLLVLPALLNVRNKGGSECVE